MQLLRSISHVIVIIWVVYTVLSDFQLFRQTLSGSLLHNFEIRFLYNIAQKSKTSEQLFDLNTDFTVTLGPGVPVPALRPTSDGT